MATFNDLLHKCNVYEYEEVTIHQETNRKQTAERRSEMKYSRAEKYSQTPMNVVAASY